MTLMRLGCQRFHRLLSEKQDREMNLAELEFISSHRSKCESCARAERESYLALNMLRMSVLEPEIDSNFNQKVIRRHRINRVRHDLRYWSPTVWGAAFATIAILAALQMVSQSSQLPNFNGSGSDARRLAPAEPDIPRLNINISPENTQR